MYLVLDLMSGHWQIPEVEEAKKIQFSSSYGGYEKKMLQRILEDPAPSSC